MTKAKETYIEEVGLKFEQSGMTRMAGRVLGALLVADPAEQAADDLAETLKASRGSISTATRYLIQLGFIERVSKSGERRDFFRNKPHAWVEMTRRGLEELSQLRDLAERGLSVLESDNPDVRLGLEEMRDFYTFAEREFPKLFERWEALKEQNSELSRQN